MLVMVVFFIAFRWIHLSTPLIRLFLLVLILLFISSISRHTIFDCDWSSDVCSSDLLQPSLSFFLSFFHETISQRLTSLVSFHQRVSYNLLIIITTIAQVDIHPFCRCFIHCDDCAWIDRKSVV